MRLANAVFADNQAAIASPATGSTGLRNSERSVVVLEDNRDIRKLICMALRPVQPQLTELADGHKFSEYIDENEPPAVVILDRMLPGLSGDRLLEKIRASQTWGDVPVVMISALRRKYDVQQLLKSGANVYLPKPLDLKTLLEVIGRYLDQNAASQ